MASKHTIGNRATSTFNDHRKFVVKNDFYKTGRGEKKNRCNWSKKEANTQKRLLTGLLLCFDGFKSQFQISISTEKNI